MRNTLNSVLQTLDIVYRIDVGHEEQIPSRGPLVVVANHPFGLAEGLILSHLMLRRRPDVRLLANELLSQVPGVSNLIIPVDVLSGRRSPAKNIRALRQALRWLDQGGALLVFPAGEVAALQWRSLRVEESVWRRAVAWLARRSRAGVLPVHLPGSNTPAFHLAGLLHPRLRTALLVSELKKQAGAVVPVRIGRIIEAHRYPDLKDEALAEYFWLRTQILAVRTSGAELPADARVKRATVEPACPDGVAAEIGALPPHSCLAESGQLSVHLASASQIPNALQEIGRLRELTFRQVGEGTGKPRDLDGFDSIYQHLILWDRQQQQIAGAYRLARVDRVLSLHGPAGLYTTTLFNLDPQFHARLPFALELGRSFVVRQYQKSYSALLLLWKAIGRCVSHHPRYRFLFGAVSISRSVGDRAIRLITSFLASHHWDPILAQYVRPRTPLCPATAKEAYIPRLGAMVPDLEELNSVLEDLGGLEKRVPVLLVHYLGLGGRVIGFHVDRQFAHAVDCLMVVDLLQTPPKLLERFMGRQQAQAFLNYHLTLPAATKELSGERSPIQLTLPEALGRSEALGADPRTVR
jgi:putative hemolysin